MALLQQLAPTYSVHGFTIRPPQGYTVKSDIKGREADTFYRFEWDGPARPDGSFPEFRVGVTQLKPGAVTVVTLDDRLTELVNRMQKDSPTMVSSPYQHGLVNDISFVRTYFKYPSDPPAQGIKHGFVYKATSNDAKYLITISGLDVEPYSTTTLPLLEASVLTFRQVQQ